MLSDLEIAQAAKLKPITEIAEKCGLLREELGLHTDFEAKVKLEVSQRLAGRPNGLTAVSPPLHPCRCNQY